VTQTDATLEAQINPQGDQAGDYYQFQLVKEPSEYASEILCPEPPPQGFSICDGTHSQGALPIGWVCGSCERLAPQFVQLDLASAGVTLKPATTYHYRVIAARRVQTEDTMQWEPPTVYGTDQTFTTPSGPPSIESESVSNITPTDATLEAQINTGGRETTYRVWVGNYPECIEEMVEECDSSAKHPITGILTGSSSPTKITVDVAHAWHALSPGSSYIYNVDATNSAWAFQGSAYGENKTFTAPAAKAPAIDSESVSHVTSTDATLEAQINTEGLETSYEFHLATPPCPSGCEHLQYIFPLPSGKLLGSSVTQSVSLDLNSAGVTLTPGQRYEYWVTATNAAGTATTLSEEKTFAATGADQAFTAAAPAQGGQPPSDSAPSGSGGPSSTPNVNAPGLQIAKTTALKSLTNAQKLAKAVKACKHKPKRKRAICVKQAHKKYSTTASKAKK
jgi:hypothetical protein